MIRERAFNSLHVGIMCRTQVQFCYKFTQIIQIQMFVHYLSKEQKKHENFFPFQTNEADIQICVCVCV